MWSRGGVGVRLCVCLVLEMRLAWSSRCRWLALALLDDLRPIVATRSQLEASASASPSLPVRTEPLHALHLVETPMRRSAATGVGTAGGAGEGEVRVGEGGAGAREGG